MHLKRLLSFALIFIAMLAIAGLLAFGLIVLVHVTTPVVGLGVFILAGLGLFR